MQMEYACYQVLVVSIAFCFKVEINAYEIRNNLKNVILI